MSQVSNSIQADQFARIATTASADIRSGLVLNVDASKITGYNDGDAVNPVPDYSSYAFSATQATVERRPIYKRTAFNGKPCLRFDGAIPTLTTFPYNAALSVTNSTFVIIASNNGNTGNGSVILKSLSYALGTNTTRLAAFTTVGKFAYKSISAIWPDNAPTIMTVTFDGTSDVSFFHNGLRLYEKIGTSTGITLNTNGVILGGDTGQLWTGDVAEVRIYNRVLSDSELAQLHSYLGAKWGISALGLDPRLMSAQHAPNYSVTPTWDGSGQIVHPSVVVAPNGTSWHGYKFWAVVMSFPGGGDAFETSNLLVSNDGDTWVVPPGVTNPVVPRTQGVLPVISDNDLFWSADGTTLWLLYRSNDVPDQTVEKIFVKSTTDGGVTWSAPVQVFDTYSSTNGHISPSVVYDPTLQKYVMIFNSGSLYGGVVRCTADTPDGTWSTPTLLTKAPTVYATFPTNHIEVVLHNGIYYMLYTDSTQNLYFTYSRDGLTWGASKLFFPIANSPYVWDDKQYYRSTFLYLPDNWHMWYTGVHHNDVSAKDEWHLGHTTLQGISCIA